MMTVDLLISALDDTWPIVIRKDKVIIRVQMTDEQATYNRLKLLDCSIKDREISRLKAAK